uniref:Uncharacterized protein n=1 Tax=Anguilla anguilla TaxID=7936 RepID=A0A0E9PRA4_ANGAN
MLILNWLILAFNHSLSLHSTVTRQRANALTNVT